MSLLFCKNAKERRINHDEKGSIVHRFFLCAIVQRKSGGQKPAVHHHRQAQECSLSGINARHFFNLCYDKRLTEADFDFSADGTTEMKMRVLPSLMKKNLSAKMLGDYNMSQPKLYTDKIAGSLSACMGFVRDGGEGRFVPNTVLEGDIRTKVKAADRIIATYRKSRSEEQYSEIVFTAKKVEWEKIVLPDEYSYLVLPE